MTKVSLKELLKSIVSGAQLLVKSGNTYAAAILTCQCVELLGRIKTDEPDFLTSPKVSSAELFRMAIEGFEDLLKYKGMLLQSADYTKHSDPEVKQLAEKAKELGENRRLSAKNMRSAEQNLDEINVKLFERLVSLGQKPKRFDLYKALRCGLTHNGVPGQSLGLTENFPTDAAYGIEKMPEERNVLNLSLFIADVDRCVSKLDNNYKTQMDKEVLDVQKCEVYNPNNLSQSLGVCTVSGWNPDGLIPGLDPSCGDSSSN